MLEVPPIFIIGSPRSGTTMLAGLLRQTVWGAPFETHFIPKYHGMLGRFGDLSDRDAFCRLVRAILRERPIAQRMLHIDPNDLYDSIGSRDYAHIVNAIGLECTKPHGRASWGDKTPDYITCIPLINQLFPDSRMIYIVRDGRDVSLSLLRRSWGPANIYSCATKWKRENERMPIIDTLRSRGLLFELRYEDLLEDPTAMIDRLLAFLGQRLDPHHVDQLAATVNRGNRLKWKEEMNVRQVELFERVAGDTLRRFGYEVSHQPGPVSLAKAVAYRAHDGMRRYRNLFVMNIVDTVKIRCFGKEPFAE